jgi:hypothetical protein
LEGGRSQIRQWTTPASRGGGLGENEANHLIYMRWRERSPQKVLTWNRQLHDEVIAAIQEAPEEWFTEKERRSEWPYDLDGHSTYHRVKDILCVVGKR